MEIWSEYAPSEANLLLSLAQFRIKLKRYVGFYVAGFLSILIPHMHILYIAAVEVTSSHRFVSAEPV